MENLNKHHSDLLSQYSLFRDSELKGRYLPYGSIEASLRRAKVFFELNTIGTSTLGRPIECLTIGNGSIKILGWSQMHGNESTTTKATFDLINAFVQFPNNPFLNFLKQHLTFKVIPMLNPDGAFCYQRENANNIDLNRDALNLKERESVVLRDEFERFRPQFCFNLHDQRSIFSAGESPVPATLSFLTPAMDDSRRVTTEREISMKVIAAIAEGLKEVLPGQIGRYSDAYNPNCTGDTFQTFGIPTVLFEAGHYPGDYMREETRRFVLMALFGGLNSIATGSYKERGIEEYFSLPENHKLFYDVILRNAKVDGQLVDIAIQFKETLLNKEILFVPYIEKIAPSISFFSHREINCFGQEVKSPNSQYLFENDIVNKLLLNNDILVIN